MIKIGMTILFILLAYTCAFADDSYYGDKIYSGVNNQYDPLETLNRNTFSFNHKFDHHVGRPLAVNYQQNIGIGSRYVDNFYNNLSDPRNAVNAMLQGKFRDSAKSIWRFMVNSTIGLGGFVDVATKFHMKRTNYDLNSTFIRYGVGTGPYFVVPGFAGMYMREFVGDIVDLFMNPLTYVFDLRMILTLDCMQAVQFRAHALKVTDEINKNSLDLYAKWRTLYMQSAKK